jgi:hypothetical protein
MKNPDGTPMITAKEIVANWLREQGYGGLYCSQPCGCGLDDFMPCGEFGDECVPAYAVTGRCSECKDPCDVFDEDSTGTVCYTTVKPDKK